MPKTVATRRGFNSAAKPEASKLVEDMRGLVWSDQKRNNRTWDQLARDAGVSYTTVRNFASGDTRSPHAITLEKLMGAMNLRFAVVSINVPRLPAEVDMAPLRRARTRAVTNQS